MKKTTGGLVNWETRVACLASKAENLMLRESS